jgi:lipopolysaccharide export system permease protein
MNFMFNPIGRLVTRMILLRFVSIVLGLTIFVLTLEIVTYVNEILALQNGRLQIVALYLAARAPSVMATFLPMAMLLAMLLTITELSYRNELTAIFAAGISPLRLLVMLLPMIIGVSLFHYILVDRLVPIAAPVLRDWKIGDYGQKKIKIGENDPIWFRTGNDIIRAAQASNDSRQLTDVVVFQRDDNGILQQQIFAKQASFGDMGWILKDAVTFDAATGKPTPSATLPYQGKLRPAEAGTRSGDPEEMTMSELNYFIANNGFGIRPAYVYDTWWFKRLTPFAVSFIMMALCIPLGTRFRRGGGLGMLFAAGVGIGFSFFVLDGIATSLGELGIFPPFFAAWITSAMFGFLALWLYAKSERV